MFSRNWKHVVGDFFNESQKIRVLTFNILAEKYLYNNINLYTKCSKEHLPWNRRYPVICQEVFEHKPDIFCLQEVEFDSFFKDLKPCFIKKNFDGVYKQKNGGCKDGCLISYNKSKFELMDYFHIDIKPELAWNWRIQIAVGVILRMKSMKDTSFMVVTTHLKFSPESDSKRCLQMQYILDRIKFMQQSRIIGDYPMIFCGDFNSCVQSSPINLLTNSYLNTHSNINGYDLDEEQFDFKSAIPLYIERNDDNMVTRSTEYYSTFVEGKPMGVADYVFYSNSKRRNFELNPVSYLEMPRNDSAVVIPNENHGSDHVPLVVDFELKSL